MKTNPPQRSPGDAHSPCSVDLGGRPSQRGCRSLRPPRVDPEDTHRGWLLHWHTLRETSRAEGNLGTSPLALRPTLTWPDLWPSALGTWEGV